MPWESAMHVQVHAPHIGAGEALRRRVYESVVAPLGPRLRGAEGTRLEVFVEDTTGTKGGEDKLCRAVLHLPHGPTLTVSGVGTDVMAVLEDVGRRLERSYRRAVSRRLDDARHPKKYYAARLEEQKARVGEGEAPEEGEEPRPEVFDEE